MVSEWDTAGQIGGFRIPILSFIEDCPLRGIKIPLQTQEKRGIARHLHAPGDALLILIEIKANITVISDRGEEKKRLVEEA